jgi:hypothetical protein
VPKQVAPAPPVVVDDDDWDDDVDDDWDDGETISPLVAPLKRRNSGAVSGRKCGAGHNRRFRFHTELNCW